MTLPIWWPYFSSAQWESLKEPHLAILIYKILDGTVVYLVSIWEYDDILIDSSQTANSLPDLVIVLLLVVLVVDPPSLSWFSIVTLGGSTQ